MRRGVAEPVVPARARRIDARERARNRAAHHHRAQTELADRVLELGNRFFGCERRNARDRNDAIAVGTVGLGHVAVEGAGERRAQLVVSEVDRGEPVGGIRDRDVDADLIQPSVEKRREHRSRAVERVAGRASPPGQAHEAELAPLRRRKAGDDAAAADDEVEPLGDRFTREVHENVAYEGQVLDDVPVTVDDRVIDCGPDRSDLHARFVPARHDAPRLATASPIALTIRSRSAREVAKFSRTNCSYPVPNGGPSLTATCAWSRKKRAGSASPSAEQSSHDKKVASGCCSTTPGRFAATSSPSRRRLPSRYATRP